MSPAPLATKPRRFVARAIAPLAAMAAGMPARPTLFAVLCCLLLSLAVAVSAGTANAGPPEGLPGPPVTGGDDGISDVDGEDSGAASDAEAERLRQEQARQTEFYDHLNKARKSERDGRWYDAAREYQAAARLQDDAEVYRGLAYARKKTTPVGQCPRRAIENLMMLNVQDPAGLWLDERGNALDWMGECGESYADERLKLAQELAALPTDARGRSPEVRVVAATLLWAQAERTKRVEKQRSSRRLAQQQIRRYLTECEEQSRAPSAEALYLLAEVEHQSERDEEALAAYRRFVAAYPDDPRVETAKGWIAEIETRQRVNALDKMQGGRPTPEAEAAYRMGVLSLRAGSVELARSQFELAVQLSPWFREPYYLLGQVHARAGRPTEAIDAWTTYAAGMPYDHRAHLDLGMLYFREFRGTQDEKARTHLEKALRLRPDLADIHYFLGELYSRTDRDEARRHFQTFLDLVDSEHTYSAAAREALRSLDSDPGGEEIYVVPPPPDEMRSLDPELQRLINEAYVVGAENGDWDRAEKLLIRANETFTGQPALLNELAKVAAAQGRAGEARGYWEESLRIDDAQVEVHERLGLLIPDPSLAQGHLRRAAELGSTLARFELAQRLWDRYQLWEARVELDLYMSEAGPYDLSWERAKLLRARVDRAFFQIYLALALATFLLLMIPAIRVYRTLRGASLRQLLSRAPKSFPEVARILSLIRHEILKHNTAFLADVGHALEVDAGDADARARLLARRLFGGPGDVIDRPGERQGIYGRFLGYCEELERVGRAYGVTLNLARKDPTFSAMLTAFEQVARRARWLRDPQSLGSTRKLELARVLRRSGHVLGREAFDRLSATIQSLCIVEIDAALIQGCFDRVAHEHQFAGVEIAPIEITTEPEIQTAVRIFRTDLEDIVNNVLRNSMASATQYGQLPVQIAVALANEHDDITGMVTMVMRIKDRSPERLTNEMLRGRYVERGMGITADLLSRYDGSIAVESELGWEKAVVLRFFVIDQVS